MQNASYRLHDADRKAFDALCKRQRLTRADGFHLLMDRYALFERYEKRNRLRYRLTVFWRGLCRFWHWLRYRTVELLVFILFVMVAGYFRLTASDLERYVFFKSRWASFSQTLLGESADPLLFDPPLDGFETVSLLPSDLLAHDLVIRTLPLAESHFQAGCYYAGWLFAVVVTYWLVKALFLFLFLRTRKKAAAAQASRKPSTPDDDDVDSSLDL